MPVRRGLICLQTILCVLVACARAPEDENSRYDLTVRARGHLENGDPGRAADLLERVAKARPHADAYVNLGIAHQARGDAKDAKRAWRRALELDPRCVGALYNTAALAYEDARADLRDAEREPRKATKLRERAASRLDEAAALVERAAAADAQNASIARLTAELHAIRGDSAAAEVARGEARRLDPGRQGADPRVFGLSKIALPTLRRGVRTSRTPPRFQVQRTTARATFLGAPDAAADGDLLVLGGTAERLSLARRDEARARTTAVPWVDRTVLAAQAGLFDSDGDLDHVIATPVSGRDARRGARAQLWLVRGGSGAVHAESLGVVDYDVLDTASLDADGDGDIDLVVAASEPPGLRLWRNDGRGRLSAEANVPGLADLAAARAVTSGDVDSDGRADLLWLDVHHQVGVLGARGNGFADVSRVTALAGQRGRAIACTDVDADGDTDVLLGDDEGFWVWSNGGAGRFERLAAYRETDSAWSTRTPRGVAVAALTMVDLDNDGLDDVVTLHFPARPPEFAAATDESAGEEDTSPASRRLAPLLDTPPQSRLALWRNEGHGVFSDIGVASGVDGTLLASTPVRASDLDRDGDLDLVCVGADSLVRLVWNLDASQNRCLEIELVDAARSSTTQGTRVELYGAMGLRLAVVQGSVARLGVGRAQAADVLRVVWPNGQVENHFDVRFPESFRMQLSHTQ